MPWYTDENGQPYTGDRVGSDPTIPDRPSPDYGWDGAEWQYQPTPNWDGLLDSLRGTPVYARLYVTANQPDSNTVAALTKTVQANFALTLLQDAVKFQNLDDLQFAIAQIRFVMAATTQGDLTPAEIAWINTQLSNNGFQLQLN